MINTAAQPIPPAQTPATPAAGVIQTAPAGVFVPKPRPERKVARPSGFATVIIAPSTNPNFPNTVTVGETGDRFSILTTNLPVKIRPLPAGRAETYYQGMTGNFEAPFADLEITNTSTTATLTLKIWIGFEDLSNYTTPILPVSSIEGLVTIGTTNTAQPLSTVDLYVRKVWIYGYNGFANGVPTNNGANIYTGKSKTYQPDLIAAGQSEPYEWPIGQMFNLANVYIIGTAGDGCFYTGT